MSAILNTYNRKKISFKRGKGSFLYSTSGKKYLDFVQGIAVNCLGHANNYLIKSIYKQSKKLWHVSNAFEIPEQEKLAKRLKQKTFADFVFFQNSGAEATEAAIKFAKRYFYSKGQSKKNRILCINNSFHGRTLATIFASNSKKATEGFGPKVDGFDHFNFGDHKSLEKAIVTEIEKAVDLIGQKYIQHVKIIENKVVIICEPKTNLDALKVRYGAMALIKNTLNEIIVAIDVKYIVKSRLDDK